MKAATAVLALFVLWAAVPSAKSGSAANANAEEIRVLLLEAAWNQAEEKKDAHALNLLLADTLSYIDYDGTLMDKSQFLVSAKDRWLKPSQITNESTTAHIYGQSAVVTGVYRETGTNHGKRYERRGRFTDTWIKVGNSWQCVASQSTLIAP